MISRHLRAVPFGRPASFAAVDSNHDGTLDLDDIKRAAAALFDELDIDRTGALPRATLGRRLSSKDFTAAGIGRHGTLTKDAYLAIVARRFEAADTDRDGTISRAEFNSNAGLALRRLFY